MPVVKLGICAASAQAKGSTLSPARCSRRLAPDSSCASPNFPYSTCVLQLPPTESTFIVNLQAPGKYVSSPTSSQPGAQPPRMFFFIAFFFPLSSPRPTLFWARCFFFFFYFARRGRNSLMEHARWVCRGRLLTKVRRKREIKPALSIDSSRHRAWFNLPTSVCQHCVSSSTRACVRFPSPA